MCVTRWSGLSNIKPQYNATQTQTPLVQLNSQPHYQGFWIVNTNLLLRPTSVSRKYPLLVSTLKLSRVFRAAAKLPKIQTRTNFPLRDG